MRMYNFKARNNLKRRALAFGLAIATLLGLTACGQKAPVEKATEPSSAIESSKETTPQTPESSGDGKPTENSTANGKPSTEVPSTEVPNADNPNADKPSADNDPPPERQEAGSDKEENEESTESSDSRQPSADAPSSEKPSTSKPSTGSSKPSTEKPSSSKPSTPSTNVPSAEKPSTEKPSESSTPSSEAPSAEKPSTQKPSSDKPSSGLTGEIGRDPDGFITEEDVNKTCNGLHDYGPKNHAIVGEKEYLNGTACYRQYQKEWEECVNCGLKLLIFDGYRYYHYDSGISYKTWTEGEKGCGKTWTTYTTYGCDCGMTNETTSITATGEHTYQKQYEWNNFENRPNENGSVDTYVHWKDACLACGDVRDEGWEYIPE